MKTTPPNDPRKLLLEIFVANASSVHWIRGFVADGSDGVRLCTELPDTVVSLAYYAEQVASLLHREGRIDQELLDRLEQRFPHEQSRINGLRGLLGLGLAIERPPSFDLLMDNWAFQDVAELFAEGPIDRGVGAIQVGEEELSWRAECWTGVALESLLSILSGIVLRDRFLVDETYVDAWNADDSPVLGLHAGGILVPFPEPEGLSRVRSVLYKDLFRALSLQRAHQENIAILRSTGRPSGSYDSEVMWGAVGYLARSAVLGATYVGHPARKRFLAQTPLGSQRPDAADFVISALEGARAQNIAALKHLTTLTLGLVVPPLLIDIIRDARSPEELVLVALQHRERYVDLRRWLAHFQRALDEHDHERIQEHSDALRTLLSCLDETRCRGSLRHDIASRTILNLPGLHRPAAVLLERLAVPRSGEEAVDKLLDLFDVAGTVLETPVLTHLRTTVMVREL